MKVINPQEELETEQIINLPSINRRKYKYSQTLGLPIIKEALNRLHKSVDTSDFEYFTSSYKEWILETNEDYEIIFTKDLIKANNKLFLEQYSDRLEFPFVNVKSNPVTEFMENQYFGIQKDIQHNQFEEYKHLLKHHVLGEEHLLRAIATSSLNHEEKGFELLKLMSGHDENLELLARKADYYNNEISELFPLEINRNGFYDPLPLGRTGRQVYLFRES